MYCIQAVRESVRLSVRLSVRAFRTLLTQYLEKYWTYFHQTFTFGAFWDNDERFKFWGQKVIVQGRDGEDALFGLVNGISWKLRD